MYKSSYEQIYASYNGKANIFPPVLYADRSLGILPNIAFFVVSDTAFDMVIVSATDGAVVGATRIKENPFKLNPEYTKESNIDITNIIVLLKENDQTSIQKYSNYLRKYYQNEHDWLLVASLCPKAIAPNELRKYGETPHIAIDKISESRKEYVFMEKEIPKEIKNIPEWFDSIPIVKAYKNAVIAGNGNRLFHVIKMSGNNAAYDKCVNDFALFLQSMGLIKDARVTNNQTGEVHSNIDILNPDVFTGYWFYDDTCNPSAEIPMVTFDITNVCAENTKIKYLCDNMGLSVTYEMLEVLLSEYTNWESIDSSVIINNTVLEHYMTNNSYQLHPNDLQWMKKYLDDKKCSSQAEEVHDGSDDAIPKIELSDDIEILEGKEEEAAQDNHILMVPDSIVSTENSASNIDGNNTIETILPEEAPNHAAINQNDNSPDLNQDNYEEDTEESAKEKILFNKELNEKMYETYEETVRKIKLTHDPRWNDFLSRYNKALDEGEYNVKTCVAYLNITGNDNHAPIYKVLYDADMATKEYEKQLKHIRMKTKCFSCGTVFSADVTSARHKDHKIKCIKCGNRISTTIDWL